MSLPSRSPKLAKVMVNCFHSGPATKVWVAGRYPRRWQISSPDRSGHRPWPRTEWPCVKRGSPAPSSWGRAKTARRTTGRQSLRHFSGDAQGIRAAFRTAAHNIEFRYRFAAGHLIGGDRPSGAEPGLRRALLFEIGDPAGFRTGRRSCILRFDLVVNLFGDGQLPGARSMGCPAFQTAAMSRVWRISQWDLHLPTAGRPACRPRSGRGRPNGTRRQARRWLRVRPRLE